MGTVSSEDARKLIGKSIYAVRKDGTTVSGKLVRVSHNKLELEQIRTVDNGKVVQARAFLLPLILFDLLVIGLVPFFGGGFGGGKGGYCGCGCGGYNACYNQGHGYQGYNNYY